ncbi:unnamed protein product [Bursaphelenchus okinawaensis]|uniref:Uncharacterized protein n=1 Tax=Bursaphelenchus okinawaensis TaxID=465554 RepID=A0A811LFZ0_9BILA|nr:unnamed protein product [Bursaphelenchus okinawaensis]CAG9121732.1 unnamed protein product [Bursaphelenchus okinawaensis]
MKTIRYNALFRCDIKNVEDAQVSARLVRGDFESGGELKFCEVRIRNSRVYREIAEALSLDRPTMVYLDIKHQCTPAGNCVRGRHYSTLESYDRIRNAQNNDIEGLIYDFGTIQLENLNYRTPC